jgi:hypothetical protein
VPADG